MRRRPRANIALALLSLMVLLAPAASAQWRVGSDSATRLTRFGRAVAYGTLMGLGFAVIDQWKKQPPEWGTGWPGYGRRAASNLGQFYIQEGVTEGLAAIMVRPLDYMPCKCKSAGDRVGWAMQGAVFDQMQDGRLLFAVPRVVGAYVGSFAQAAWRPNGGENRAATALVNGTSSLAIGALINLYYEFRHHPSTSQTSAGDRK